MTKPREQKPTTTYDIAEVPLEESAGLLLLHTSEAFNTGTEARRSMSSGDSDALAEIGVLYRNYAAAAVSAWRSNVSSWCTAPPVPWGDIVVPDEVKALEGVIADYVVKCQDDHIEMLGSGLTMTWQAIEGEPYRRALAREGAVMIGQINTAIAAGRSRVSVARAEEQKRRDAVRFWLSIESTREIIVGIVGYVDTHTATTIHRPGALADLRREQQTMIETANRNEEPIPHQQLYSEQWRFWVFIARQILAETEQTVARDGGGI